MDDTPFPIINARLLSRKQLPLKAFPAFEKHFQIPKSADHRARNWLAEISFDLLDQDLQSVLDQFRKSFKFRRRQMEIFGPLECRAGIESPYFNYQSWMSFAPDDCAYINWERQIDQIRDANKVVSTEFEDCFGETGWRLIVDCKQPLSVVDMIDRIEDLEDDSIQVDYDKDFSACRVRLASCVGELKITESSYEVVAQQKTRPVELFSSLTIFQNELFARVHAGQE